MESNLEQRYRFQDGRRYHAFDEGAYYLPNDEAEASRLGERGCNLDLLSISDCVRKTCSI